MQAKLWCVGKNWRIEAALYRATFGPSWAQSKTVVMVSRCVQSAVTAKGHQELLLEKTVPLAGVSSLRELLCVHSLWSEKKKGSTLIRCLALGLVLSFNPCHPFANEKKNEAWEGLSHIQGCTANKWWLWNLNLVGLGPLLRLCSPLHTAFFSSWDYYQSAVSLGRYDTNFLPLA